MSIISYFPSGGTNVSPTTATINDVAEGKIFFLSNGDKATGALPDYRGVILAVDDETGISYDPVNGVLVFRPAEDSIIGSQNNEGLYALQSWVAYKIGLINSPTETKSSKIMAGSSVLGIRGTGGITTDYTVKLLNSSASPSLLYVFYEGNELAQVGDMVDVLSGDTIRCVADVSNNNIVYVDNVLVASGDPVDYSYTVMGSITVTFGASTIYINTSNISTVGAIEYNTVEDIENYFVADLENAFSISAIENITVGEIQNYEVGEIE